VPLFDVLNLEVKVQDIQNALATRGMTARCSAKQQTIEVWHWVFPAVPGRRYA